MCIDLEGRDSSLRHYLPKIPPHVLRVFHCKYTDEAEGEIMKCKILSKAMSKNPLSANADKCILVNRMAAIFSFASAYTGHVLSRCAQSLVKGIDDPAQIASTLGKDILGTPISLETIEEAKKAM